MNFFETQEQRDCNSSASVVAARKAANTRRARTAFQGTYPSTWNIAKMVLEEKVDVLNAYFPKMTIAAVKANLSRPGKYRDMALACNYQSSSKCKSKKPKK